MRFPSQAQKKHGNSDFKQKILILFSRGSHHKPKKTTEIPFSNRRYWHYFPEVPITSPKKGKSRFQIEDIGIIFQKSPKSHGNPVFKQKLLALFSRGCHHKPKKTTEIPFSNRRYWHYFPEVPITSPKKGKSRFQIEDIGIIFQKSPKRHGNPVFKQKILALFSRGSHHKPNKTTEFPFLNRRYWHCFPEVPITSPKKGKSRFQIEDIGIIFQKSPKRHGNPVFK